MNIMIKDTVIRVLYFIDMIVYLDGSKLEEILVEICTIKKR